MDRARVGLAIKTDDGAWRSISWWIGSFFFFLILSRSIANLLFDWNGWLNRWLGTEDLELGGTAVREMKTPKTWLHVPMCSQSDGERKTWDQRLICVISLVKEQWDLVFFFFLFELWKERMFFFRFLFCGRKREDEIYFGAEAMWEKFGHGSMNVSSWMALIPCGKPKSNDNGKYKRVIERGRERRLGFFKWFGYVSLRPHDVANGLHLYYILCIIFWMIIMCCEVSSLYIGLLTQLSYLTYVRFLNSCG